MCDSCKPTCHEFETVELNHSLQSDKSETVTVTLVLLATADRLCILSLSFGGPLAPKLYDVAVYVVLQIASSIKSSM